MTEANRQIRDAIQVLAGTKGLSTKFMLGKVTEVQEDERTCSVEVQLGDHPMTLTGINLSAENNDGLVEFPAVDSTVLICLLSNNSGFVVKMSDLDKVICVIDSSNKFEFDSTGFIWNDGLNGGLIKIVDLTTKLNLLLAQIQANHALIAAAIGSLGGSYTPSALTTFQKSNYENTKILH